MSDAHPTLGVRVRARRAPGGRASVVLSVRLDPDEWEAIARVAEQEGSYVSRWVREVVVKAARRRLAR